MYHNPYSSGYEALRKTSSYLFNENSSSISASYVTNSPNYVSMFYYPSDHEVINSIRYRLDNPEYDMAFREMQESLSGHPMEFYLPQQNLVADGVGKGLSNNDNSKFINPSNEIINEILKAQEQIKSISITDFEIEETITIQRKIRKKGLIIKLDGK